MTIASGPDRFNPEEIIAGSEMCHPRCVYKFIGGGIKSITQQVYLMMFITG